ncbi:hypothetical protein GQ53DRAFT_747872 [Thozetella sp. PMI_491]|nr:hypothetical protein GQ53DRAFT_747872 [Thozetella sp. PMI_491]
METCRAWALSSLARGQEGWGGGSWRRAATVELSRYGRRSTYNMPHGAELLQSLS